MEGVAIGEMVGTGAETHMGCWDADLLVSLYGSVDVYLSEYDSDQPVDYDVAIQEQSLEPLPAD